MCRNTHPLFCLLPSIALDDVAFIVRYDAAGHGHVIVVEIRADASCGLVGSCCECNKYGSGYGDALDVKVIIEVAFFIFGKLRYADAAFFSYTTQAVRTGVRGEVTEGGLQNAVAFIHFEVVGATGNVTGELYNKEYKLGEYTLDLSKIRFVPNERN